MVEIDGNVVAAVKSFSIQMSLNVGPFQRALAELAERTNVVHSATVSFAVAFRKNRRQIRRMFGIAEPLQRLDRGPRRRKHPSIRRRPTRSQTRRVRTPGPR